MPNSFDVNRQVALAHVRAEQTKGWFLAQSRFLVILLSGAMLFLGVVLLFGKLHFSVTWDFLMQVLAVAPIAVVSGFLAVVIEGGTVFTSAVFRECLEKTTRELEALQKVAHKFKAEEVKQRREAIKKRRTGPFLLMLVFVSFSCLGAELFWQEIMNGQEWYFHVIGAVLGLVCSSLLILLEVKSDVVERIIEKCISSSALIALALDQSAKSQIYEAVFESQQEYINSPEVRESVATAVQKRLHGVLAETVSVSGVSVTAEQLTREIKRQREERAAAEAYLQSGNEAALQLPAGSNSEIEFKRKSRNRAAVEKAVAKYGLSRMANDPDKYADELGMDARTLKKHLEDIANSVA